MSNTTAEFWEIDGVSLNTYARNIASLTGRLGVPQMRGEDDLIPFRAGELWLPKMAGPRILTLGMWVLGCNAEGVVPAEMRGLFNDNLAALRKLLWVTWRQQVITRRVKNAAGAIVTTTGLCQFQSGLEPETEVPGRAKFTVDLKMADPYFRPAVSTSAAIPGTVNNPGDDVVRDMVIDTAGGVTITNTTTGQVLTIPAGITQVNTGTFAAVGGSAALVTTNHLGGDLSWMGLVPGDNVFTGGTGTITFKPVYL